MSDPLRDTSTDSRPPPSRRHSRSTIWAAGVTVRTNTPCRAAERARLSSCVRSSGGPGRVCLGRTRSRSDGSGEALFGGRRRPARRHPVRRPLVELRQPEQGCTSGVRLGVPIGPSGRRNVHGGGRSGAASPGRTAAGPVRYRPAAPCGWRPPSGRRCARAPRRAGCPTAAARCPARRIRLVDDLANARGGGARMPVISVMASPPGWV